MKWYGYQSVSAPYRKIHPAYSTGKAKLPTTTRRSVRPRGPATSHTTTIRIGTMMWVTTSTSAVITGVVHWFLLRPGSDPGDHDRGHGVQPQHSQRDVQPRTQGDRQRGHHHHQVRQDGEEGEEADHRRDHPRIDLGGVRGAGAGEHELGDDAEGGDGAQDRVQQAAGHGSGSHLPGRCPGEKRGDGDEDARGPVGTERRPGMRVTVPRESMVVWWESPELLRPGTPGCEAIQCEHLGRVPPSELRKSA